MEPSIACLERVMCVALLCTLAAGVVAMGRETQNQATPVAASPFHEEVIAEMAPGSEWKQGLAGNKHLAWVEKQGNKRTVRLDGKQQGGVYEDVKYPEFSSDEEHLAFFGKRNSVWIFVLDGQEHSQEYTKVSALDFQPTGSSISYCACREKKCHLVVDGAETGAEYEDISHPQYSRDGKRLSYFGKKGKKWIAVVDGKEMAPELDDFWYSDWGFSHDGSRFFAAGRIKGDWIYIVDGTLGPGFKVLSHIAFSSDAKHYAYGATVAKGGLKKQKTVGTIVVDGQTTATYEGKGFGGFWKEMGGTTEFIVEGVRDLSPDFHGISTPQFNRNGKLVYAARREKGDVVVLVSGEAGPGFDEILTPAVFSEDSQHFAYVARNGDDFIEVRDNLPVRTVRGAKHGATGVQWIAMSLDATHLAYVTVSGGKAFQEGKTGRAIRSVVIDGRAGAEYNALDIDDFDFDNDARHYVYEVHGAKGDRDAVNVDGHESRLYDSVTNAHIGAEAKTAAFFARDGARLLRVTFALE